MNRCVAPYTGAWIETGVADRHQVGIKVAPYTGAWIETTSNCGRRSSGSASHPIRVRGLKLGTDRAWRMAEESHPIRVRGLKRACWR